MIHLRQFLCLLLALALVLPPQVALAQKAPRPSLIRDAEIEGFLRQLSRPIFKAAGINSKSVKVYLIADNRINAFVAGGQRIFVHTGLLTQTKTPNEIIGVLAHESGHIAGGHLAGLEGAVSKASVESIIGMLVGTAAVVGGALAGNKGAAQAGSGIFAGTQGLAQRNLLSYQRSMESAADQLALDYLRDTQQSAAGMISLFDRLASQNIAALDRADPYLQSHPMPLDRIRNLEVSARKSPFFAKADSVGMKLRHDLVKAKLAGYMEPPQKVFQRYPPSNLTMPARYARAIALFRKGDIGGALPLINSLTEELPENPYFWELEAQAYLENAKPDKGLPAIEKARAFLPDNGLLQHVHAQLLLATDRKASAEKAVGLLRQAIRSEGDVPVYYKDLARAYALKGDIGRAELATAEFALMTGDRKLAKDRATSALALFRQGSPEWVKANDIRDFAGRKKK